MKAHILAFGVHPDDIELACAGTLIAAVAEGKTVVAVDLTRGELGSRGSADLRDQEAAAAAKVMGLAARENLRMEDGFFQVNEENIRKVVTVIRKYQPDIVLCNATEDRHPDHGRSAKLVSDAAFLSGLRKIITQYEGQDQLHWRPAYVFHYLQDKYMKPDFVVDISDHIEKKIEAVLCYGTQFNAQATAEEPATYISDPSFMDTVKGRSLMLGKRAGVQYAEGFFTAKTPAIKSFDAFVQVTT